MNSGKYTALTPFFAPREISSYRKLQSAAKKLKERYPFIRINSRRDVLIDLISQYDPTLLPEECRDEIKTSILLPTIPPFVSEKVEPISLISLPLQQPQSIRSSIRNLSDQSSGSLIPTFCPSGSLVPTFCPSGSLVPTFCPSGSLVPTCCPSGSLVPTCCSSGNKMGRKSDRENFQGHFGGSLPISQSVVRGRGRPRKSESGKMNVSSTSTLGLSAVKSNKFTVVAPVIDFSMTVTPLKSDQRRLRKNDVIKITTTGSCLNSLAGSAKPDDLITLVFPIGNPSSVSVPVPAPIKRGVGRPRRNRNQNLGGPKILNGDISGTLLGGPIPNNSTRLIKPILPSKGSILPLCFTPTIPLIPSVSSNPSGKLMGSMDQGTSSLIPLVSSNPFMLKYRPLSPVPSMTEENSGKTDQIVDEKEIPEKFSTVVEENSKETGGIADETKMPEESSVIESNLDFSEDENSSSALDTNVELLEVSSPKLPLPLYGSFNSGSPRQVKSLASSDRLNKIDTGVGTTFSTLPTRIKSASSLRSFHD